jgi:hypothetical protein
LTTLRMPRPCTLKYIFCRFRKRVGALQLLQKTKISSSTPIFILFKWQSNAVDSVDQFLTFLYIVGIYCWSCSRPEYSWNTVRLTSFNAFCNNLHHKLKMGKPNNLKVFHNWKTIAFIIYIIYTCTYLKSSSCCVAIILFTTTGTVGGFV